MAAHRALPRLRQLSSHLSPQTASMRLATTTAVPHSHTHPAPPSHVATAPLPKPRDASAVFATAAHDEAYWDAYLAARPRYDAAHYAAVYAYHGAGPSARWALAHDVGTGPGQVAAELASRFSRVVASDNSAEHLAAARHRLGRQGLQGRIELAQVAAEDLAAANPPAATDLVAAAECMPLLDAPRAVAGWARMLRPGGTLAAWFYGRPAFADAALRDGPAGRLLEEVLDLSFARAIRAAGPAAAPNWKRATDRMASWLDDVELPPAQFRDVRRIKWNPDLPLAFYSPRACSFAVEASSAIAPGESVERVTDRSKWAKRWDIRGIRQFVWANLPGISAQAPDPAVEDKFAQLEAALGGPDAVHDICWPIVLILARRR